MSQHLPVVTGAEAQRAFQRLGWVFDRQHGSHAVLRHPDHPGRRLVVAMHGKQAIPKGTLRSLIQDAGLTVDEFRGLL